MQPPHPQGHSWDSCQCSLDARFNHAEPETTQEVRHLCSRSGTLRGSQRVVIPGRCFLPCGPSRPTSARGVRSWPAKKNPLLLRRSYPRI